MNVDVGRMEDTQLLRYRIVDGVDGEQGAEGGDAPHVQGEVALGSGGEIRDGRGQGRGKGRGVRGETSGCRRYMRRFFLSVGPSLGTGCFYKRIDDLRGYLT